MSKYLSEVAICGIVVIVCVALYSGVNGILLSSAISGIAGIAGYTLGQRHTEELHAEQGAKIVEKYEFKKKSE